MTNEDKVNWHRLMGLVLEPLFKLLGYQTCVEYDLSKKQQFIDLIVIENRGEASLPPELPEEFWSCFGTLNQYNLVSFKSYSESFNAIP